MAGADLEAGRLIALSSVAVRLGQPYCAFMLPAKAERADIAGWSPCSTKRRPRRGSRGRRGTGTDGGYQLAGFCCGNGETGMPGPIFCRLPVITWSPSATPLRTATWSPLTGPSDTMRWSTVLPLPTT